MKRLHALAFRLIRFLPSFVLKWGVFLLKRKYVIGVVAIVPNDSGEVLFLHHTYRQKRAWRLPGGLKERREDPFATAEREMKEEANMTVRALQVVGVHQADITFDILVLCERVLEHPFEPNAEIDDFVWANPFFTPFEVPEGQLRAIETALRIRSVTGRD